MLSTVTGCAQPIFVIAKKVLEKVAKRRAAQQVAAEYGGFAIRVEPLRAAGLSPLRPARVPMNPYVYVQLLSRGLDGAAALARGVLKSASCDDPCQGLLSARLAPYIYV